MSRATQEDWDRYHKELSFGDPHAEEFSCMWSSFCHMIDDVVDKEEIDPVGFVSELIRVIDAFSFNPFYLQHKRELHALIVQSASAFLDSFRWAESGETLQTTHANALRAFYDCVNYQVAYISSGYNFDKMRKLTQKWRDFNWIDVNASGVTAWDERWKKD